MKKTDNIQTSNAEMVTISRAEYEEKNARLASQDERISRLENQVELLTEALRLSRHKQFGASSEKSEDTLMEQLSFLFNEAEVFSAAEKKEADRVTVVAAHKRHKKHEYALDNIPEGMATKQVEHRLEGKDLVCPQCGDTMSEIGKEVVRTLELIPAQTIIREDIYYTYACPTCNKEDVETPVVKAPREKNIIPGSFATPEAIAHIMAQKFVMGSPLYRQEQELNRKGIHLSRQTMSNWILKAAEDYLVPVYDQLRKELLTRDVLHADETTLQVLHEPGKKPQSDSYMWLYRTGGNTDNPIVLYEYQPSRGAKHPKEFLNSYKGYLHTDGYAGYHDLGEEITVVGCWAHARRKFDEAVKSLPKGKSKGSSASQGLTYCNLLFGIEQEIADKTAEERYEERLKQAKPVLDLKYVELYSNPDNYAALTYENTLIMAEEIAPLVTPDEDDPKAMRFDALMYGIELAYLVGKKYTKARSDLFKKVSGIAGVANIPEIKAQSELIQKILQTDYLDNAGISEFEHIRECLRGLIKYIPQHTVRYTTNFDDRR